MANRVYIETTIVSYLTAWPSRDVVIAGHQQVTREWWEVRGPDYELCISQLVLDEAMAGDQQAARSRLDVMRSMLMLETIPASLGLAKDLLRAGALPKKAASDALHIAIAASMSIPYLLTWNCRHLANATMRPTINKVCGDNGFVAPIICTPDELMGVE